MAGELTRDDVERYLQSNKRGRGLFASLALGAAFLGFSLVYAAGGDDGSSSSARRQRERRTQMAFLFGALPAGFVGLGIAVTVDKVRRRMALGLTSAQITQLDEALVDNGDIGSPVTPQLVERTLHRANGDPRAH